MSAYRQGFLTQIIKDSSAAANSLAITPPLLYDYELLMAEDEVIVTMAGDNVQGLSSTVSLKIVAA